MRRGIALALMAAGLAGVAFATSAGWAGAQENVVQVVPDEAPPGVTVSVTHGPGQTCGVPPNPGDDVAIRLVEDGAPTVAVRDTVPVDPDGGWSVDLTVPDVAPGSYQIEAECRTGGEVGFGYTPVAFTVLGPPASTTTSATTATTVAERPTTSDDPGSTAFLASQEPPADVGGLLGLAVLAALIGLGGGWWLLGRLGGAGGGGLTTVGVIGLLCAIVFTAAWVVAGRLTDEIGEKADGISALAIPGAEAAGLLTGGFLLGGLLLVWFSLGGLGALRWCGESSPAPWFGVGVGLGLIALGALRSDCARGALGCDGDRSWHHDAHTVVGLLCMAAAVIAAFTLATVLRRLGLGPLAGGATAAGALMLVFWALALARAGEDGAGLFERGGLLVTAALIAWLSLELLRRGRAPTSR